MAGGQRKKGGKGSKNASREGGRSEGRKDEGRTKGKKEEIGK